MIAGNTVVWKGSESASLVSVATSKIMTEVLEKNGFGSVFTLCMGDGANVGEHMVNSPRLPLVSFTGSTKVGRHVSERLASRFGKQILELGGNNAAVIMDDAD